MHLQAGSEEKVAKKKGFIGFRDSSKV